MGKTEDNFAFEAVSDRTLNLSIRLSVNKACSIVNDGNVTLSDQSSDQSKELSLTKREVLTFFSNEGVQSDSIMGCWQSIMSLIRSRVK